MAPDVKQQLMKGKNIDPSRYYFRTAWTFETSALAYVSLNRLIAVGVAERTSTGMITDVFAVE